MLVWIIITATVTKVVEGCIYLRRRYYEIFAMRWEESSSTPLSALRSASLSSLSSKKQRLQISSSDRVAVRASAFGLYEHTSG